MGWRNQRSFAVVTPTTCQPSVRTQRVGLLLDMLAGIDDPLGRAAEARTEYKRALELAQTEPNRRFLQRRVAEVSA